MKRRGDRVRGAATVSKHPSLSPTSCQGRTGDGPPCLARPTVEVALAVLTHIGMDRRTARLCPRHFELLVRLADVQIIATRPWPVPDEIE